MRSKSSTSGTGSCRRWIRPGYDSPEAYLDAVRYRPLDTSFSYITSRAANDAFYSESQYIGFGLSTSVSATEMRVLQVFDDSPATEAGLDRGARITAIDGVAMTTLIATGAVDSRVRAGHRRRGGQCRVHHPRRHGPLGHACASGR